MKATYLRKVRKVYRESNNYLLREIRVEIFSGSRDPAIAPIRRLYLLKIKQFPMRQRGRVAVN